MTTNEKIENLKVQLGKAVFNKWNPSINNKRIDKIAREMRYLESFYKN